MYDFLSGRVAARKPTYAVIDAGGVGYRVEITLSTFERLPREGAVKLFTYLKVTDDDLRLYGFLTEREREVFLKLVEGVQQLGPSKAIAILSTVSPEELMRAIDEGDVAYLRRIKGVGEKIANRLVVELKGKLPPAAGLDGGGTSKNDEAVRAMMSLGYDRKPSEEAVRRALKYLGEKSTVEDVIRRSLQHV